MSALSFRSPLSAYEHQADLLLAGLRAADPAATTVSLDDARLTIARSHSFVEWASLAAYVEAVSQDGPFYEFESAVEAVVNGDLNALQDALRRDASLVMARSRRLALVNPPQLHRATLLHYVAANGVEQCRQKTPPNAVEIARSLLQGGAEVDALADLYGVECTTMTMLVSSDHPAAAGLQAPLVELLLDFGAAIEGRGTGYWGTPLVTALAFGMSAATVVLVERGARIDLPCAAGLGLMEDAERLLPAAAAEVRHVALALAARHGHPEIVRLLLDAGEDPNRYNPEGTQGHSTPLHQAVWGGHDATVRLLVERGARLDIRDTRWNGTPLGWAVHGGKLPMADHLRTLGATE